MGMQFYGPKHAHSTQVKKGIYNKHSIVACSCIAVDLFCLLLAGYDAEKGCPVACSRCGCSHQCHSLLLYPWPCAMPPQPRLWAENRLGCTTSPTPSARWQGHLLAAVQHSCLENLLWFVGCLWRLTVPHPPSDLGFQHHATGKVQRTCCPCMAQYRRPVVG